MVVLTRSSILHSVTFYAVAQMKMTSRKGSWASRHGGIDCMSYIIMHAGFPNDTMSVYWDVVGYMLLTVTNHVYSNSYIPCAFLINGSVIGL